MTAFVAVVAGGREGHAEVPASCVAALGVAGARAPVSRADGAVAIAAAAWRPHDPGLAAASTCIAAGDVRLDDRVGLQRALRPGGPAPPERSDIELVVAAHAAWGTAAPARLRGDFSYAVWDAAARTLVGARDGLGVRPLFYAQVPGGLVVSNLLDAVRAHPAVPATLHEPAVTSFLAVGWNVETTTTTFAAIRRLPPGSALTWAAEGGVLRLTRHWSLPEPALWHPSGEAECVERYRAVLGAAVGDRVAPAGTLLFLSGGLDSPSIAATARRVASGATLHAVTTRTTGVESDEEARLAAAVATGLGIPHRVLESGVHAAPAAGRRTPEPLDEPEFDGFCTMLSALATDGAVAIEGEDGDALFYPPGLRATLAREPVVGALWRVVSFTIRHGWHPYLGFWLSRRLSGRRVQEDDGAPPWFTPAAAKVGVPREDRAERHPARPHAAASLGGSIWQSVHAASDRAYHGAPVEYRWPLLDSRVVEFVFSLPAVPWCQRKHLPRRAFASELPAAVIERRKTTVPGYHEALVAGWRERTRARFAPLHEVTARFVDEVSLAETLERADDESVMGAWRALQLDAWVRGAGVS